MSGDGYKLDVFIGYHVDERGLVADILKGLKSAGLSVRIVSPDMSSDGSLLSRETTLVLGQARALILLFSASSRDELWRAFEEQSLRFRDPASPTRRFIPVRMFDADLPESMRGIEHVTWGEEQKSEVIQRLVMLCKPSVVKRTARGANVERLIPRNRTSLGKGGARSLNET